MCRYREYHFSCSHVKTESPPYLPCNPDDFCLPEDSDPPIKINKATACGDEDCAASKGMSVSPSGNGGTSWTRTNSMNRGSGLGEEGDPSARLRHTVSTNMKIAKIVRSMTKKNKQPKNSGNGVDGFLPDQHENGRYNEIGSEMDDLKK